MKITRKASAGNDFVLLGVGTDLVSIHANHGDLDGAGKVEIVVAQVIGGCLEAVLIELRRVVDNLVEYWLSSCNSGFMRYHVEIKNIVKLILNETCINYCARARIKVILILLRKESVLNVTIDQAEHNLRLVSLSGILEHIGYHLNFVFLHLSGH